MEKKMSALVLAGAMAAGCASTRAETIDAETLAVVKAISDKMMHLDALRTIGAENEGRQPDGSFVCCATAASEEFARKTATGCANTFSHIGLNINSKAGKDSLKEPMLLSPSQFFSLIKSEHGETYGPSITPITFPTPGDGVDVKLGSTVYGFDGDFAGLDHADTYLVCARATRKGVSQALGE